MVTTIPTIGFNVEQVTYKNLKFQVWDLGGQTSIRPYWRCYYSNTDAVIYVVDSADRDRVGISKQELVSMLEEEELKSAILVVLANKQDIEGAMSVTEVRSMYSRPSPLVGDSVGRIVLELYRILNFSTPYSRIL